MGSTSFYPVSPTNHIIWYSKHIDLIYRGISTDKHYRAEDSGLLWMNGFNNKFCMAIMSICKVKIWKRLTILYYTNMAFYEALADALRTIVKESDIKTELSGFDCTKNFSIVSALKLARRSSRGG